MALCQCGELSRVTFINTHGESLEYLIRTPHVASLEYLIRTPHKATLEYSTLVQEVREVD